MLWNCSYLEEFWKYIIRISSDIRKTKIPPNPRVWILGDTLSLNESYNKKNTYITCGHGLKKVYSAKLEVRASSFAEAMAK